MKNQHRRIHNPVVAFTSIRSSRVFRWSIIPVLALMMVAGGGTWLWGGARDTFHTRSVSNSRDETKRQFTSNSPSDNFPEQSQPQPQPQPQPQRLVILAGPHKTGTSSMQTNLWKWSTSLHDISNDDRSDGGNHRENGETTLLPNWVWAVPPKIIEIESSDPHPWKWTASKGFYPLLEALRNYKDYGYSLPSRSLFRDYTTDQIVDMYSNYLEQVWRKGYDIIMGTEAMDSLVKDKDGVGMLRRLVREVLPFTSTDATSTISSHTKNQTNNSSHKNTTTHKTQANVTIVIAYRTPKHRHLVSIWHQNALQKNSPGFYDWFTTTNNGLGALDALGMADMILHNTEDHWNVVLVDISGVKKHNWDISNLIACSVLDATCDAETKGIVGARDPLVMNVREDKKPPDVSDEVLQEMEPVLRDYDCNYRHLFDGDAYKDRLQILLPLTLLDVMENCNKKTTPPPSRKVMKEKIVKIAIKGGKKEK